MHEEDGKRNYGERKEPLMSQRIAGHVSNMTGVALYYGHVWLPIEEC